MSTQKMPKMTFARSLLFPDIDFDISCRGFFNCYTIKGLSISITSAIGNIVNSGSLQSSLDDMRLMTQGTFVNSGTIHSYSDIDIRGNKILNAAIIDNDNSSIKLTANDSLFLVGGKVKSARESIFLHGKKHNFVTLLLNFELKQSDD